MITPLESLISHLQAALTVARQMQEQTPPQAEQPPLEGEMVVKIVERLDLEKTSETNIPDIKGIDLPTEKVDTTNPKAPGLEYIERDSDKFLKLLEFSLFKGWQKSHVDSFLISKGLALSAKNEEHLQECRNFAAMEKRGEMSIPTLLDQSCLSAAEKEMLTAKYLF